jgi:hypothetical protein
VEAEPVPPPVRTDLLESSFVVDLELDRYRSTIANRHVKRVLMKLELRDRVHAVVFAYETGLVSPTTN